MSEDERAEIERLAADYHAKSQRFHMMGFNHMPSDPVAAQASAVSYELAGAEVYEARNRLEAAKNRLGRS